MPSRTDKFVTRRAVVAVTALWAVLLLGACSSNQSSTPPAPPSPPSGLPSPLPSPPSQPSQPSSTPSQPSSPSSSSGQSQPSTGSPPPGDGSVRAPAGDAQGRSTPGDAGDAGGEPGWEQGLPGGGGGDDDWQTSNQLPGAGGTSRIPPMPSERDRPRGTPGDEVLDGALEDFDGEILAEREVIRARSNETAGREGSGPYRPQGDGTGSAAGGLPDSEAGEGSGRPGAVTDAPPMPGGAVGMPSSRGRATPPAPSVVGRIPDDIPDAGDDDIVARQLREAAMAETDPVLKEKLWEEYRQYKGI